MGVEEHQRKDGELLEMNCGIFWMTPCTSSSGENSFTKFVSVILQKLPQTVRLLITAENYVSANYMN